MEVMTFEECRAHFAETLDSVIDDREEVVISRSGREPVIVLALDDYRSIQEIVHLFRSPENGRRLLDAIDRLEHGTGEGHDLTNATG